MQQLRLIGVHEDGEHLLLSDEAGEEFSLPITEALRSAATRPIGRPSAPAADANTGVLSPKDIQAQIRAGASADQVAFEFGLDVERVRKYEGPVLAERDWTAQLARRVEVAAPQPGHDLYRSTFGDDPATLDEMVRHRVSAMGMDSSTLRWDAWRGQDGTWTVIADFSTAGLESAVGEQPPAVWSFRPTSRHLENKNRWAQVLSELDPLDGPFGSRRLSAVGDRPFNVEEEDHDDVPAPSPFPAPVGRGPRPAVDADSQDELLDVLRARRGQRLGADEEGDDELALMLTRDEQPNPEPTGRPRLRVAGQDEPSDTDTDSSSASEGTGATAAVGVAADAEPVDDAGFSDVDGADTDDVPTTDGDDDGSGPIPLPLDFPTARTVSPQDEEEDEDWIQERSSARDTARRDRGEHSGVRGQIDGQTDALEPPGGTSSTTDASEQAADAEPERESTSGSRRRNTRPKRSSVPSWDEIVFGRKND